ncbi:MAG: twin-arginine translocation signal domain-containing protein, partial [Terracidiphilus sp.]
MKNTLSRRNFLQTGALAAACAVSGAAPALAEAVAETGKPSPIK